MASLVFIALVVLWLGQTSARVYQKGADALTIRAVLRADTDDVAAEILAADIRRQVPDVAIDVINEAMGRSLLALQEPWIAQMPDFEVTPLPILLEIRHPQLLTQSDEIPAFLDSLGEYPAVDFVAYNETAHDRLAKFAASSAAIERHAVRWLLGGLALAGFAAIFACSRLAGNLSFLGQIIGTLTIYIPGWGVAWAAFRHWETIAIATGDWQRLGLTTHLTVGVAALVIILSAKALSKAVTWFRQ